jgi:hypothetical protein
MDAASYALPLGFHELYKTPLTSNCSTSNNS